MTNDHSATRLARWPAILPFILGDIVFLAAAGLIWNESPHPLDRWRIAALVICVGGGAWLSVWPFVWDAKAAVRLAEIDTLSSVSAEIQNVQLVSTQIKSVTGQWAFAHEQANKTVEAANAIATRMSTEAKAFSEFMVKANDSEKANLRLEVEKLRRVEGEWLQLMVRMLDHVYALHQAGIRSGQPALIQQLGNFQAACRDVARRTGLVPFQATPGEAFDEKTHQYVEEQGAPAAGAIVAETVATGYTFQGQLLRKALVVMEVPTLAEPSPEVIVEPAEIESVTPAPVPVMSEPTPVVMVPPAANPPTEPLQTSLF